MPKDNESPSGLPDQYKIIPMAYKDSPATIIGSIKEESRKAVSWIVVIVVPAILTLVFGLYLRTLFPAGKVVRNIDALCEKASSSLPCAVWLLGSEQNQVVNKTVVGSIQPAPKPSAESGVVAPALLSPAASLPPEHSDARPPAPFPSSSQIIGKRNAGPEGLSGPQFLKSDASTYLAFRIKQPPYNANPAFSGVQLVFAEDPDATTNNGTGICSFQAKVISGSRMLVFQNKFIGYYSGHAIDPVNELKRLACHDAVDQMLEQAVP